MPGLYIGSAQGFAGKNLLVMALGLQLQKEGYRVGYMRPVGTSPAQKEDKTCDEDAAFVQEVLGLQEDPELISPVLATHDLRMEVFYHGCPDLMKRIVQAYEILSQDKDIMLVSGAGSFLHSGKYCNVAGVDVASSLGTKVMLLDRFLKDFSYDYLISAQEQIGEELMGVVLNGVPESHMDTAEKMLKPMLERRDIPVLGIIPQDSLLNAIRIGELANRLGGKIITVPEKSDIVTENFLIGTMQVENFMIHFRKRPNSAVIVGGDRSDLQLVALEGKCPCLILTGNLYPNDIILARSEDLGVPIIVVRDDTYTVAKKMEQTMNSIKLRDQVKINHGSKLVSSLLDWSTIKQSLGLA